MEDPMAAPKTAESALPGTPPENGALTKMPSALRKLLASTPEKDWPRLKTFLIESQEEGQIVDLLPEMNRVMKTCPARTMGRVGRREISADQLEKGWTQLYDSLHGVRHAQQELLYLAGFEDVRPPGETDPEVKAGAPDPEPLTEPRAPKPEHARAI
jgi:hypothetical protein